MNYSDEDRRRYLILQCRYYKGEPSAPKPLNDAPVEFSLFWDYERLWVEWSMKGDPMLKTFEEEINAYNLKSKEGDNTPLTLKALLLNRYLHWGGYGPIEDELKSFENWYAREYLKWKTNREHRADKRRPELISKCLYYHGEKDNPWDFPQASGFNHWRGIYWKIEQEWVNQMSMSYNFSASDKSILMKLGLLPYFKSKGHPLSLVAQVLNYHNQVALTAGLGEITKADAIDSFKSLYLKFVPHGIGMERYFNFYLGEKENPWKGVDIDFFEAFWNWELAVARELKECGEVRSVKNADFSSFSENSWYRDPKVPVDYKALCYHIIAGIGMWVYASDEVLEAAYMKGVYTDTNK